MRKSLFLISLILISHISCTFNKYYNIDSGKTRKQQSIKNNEESVISQTNTYLKTTHFHKIATAMKQTEFQCKIYYKIKVNEKRQFLVTLPRESFDLGQNVAFCLQNLTISESRILKNYVGKVDHFAILIIILTIVQNCDIVDMDSHYDFCFLFHFQK